jgi:hypothetical protein
MRSNGLRAGVLALALLLPATGSLAQVVNQNFTITDSTDTDTRDALVHTGATNSGTAQTICRNGTSTATVTVATTHPESVRFKKNTVKMEQKALGNDPTVRVQGAVGLVFNVLLTCTSASYTSSVDNAPNVSAGKFDVRADGCTGLTQARADYLLATCAADTANTTIQFELDGTTVNKLRIRGAGTTAFVPAAVP